MASISVTAALLRAWRGKPRTTRVTEIYCQTCGRWRHPRHFGPDAVRCCDCDQ